MAAVSIIIPVYNTEKYLRRCLDSVCNQTLKDIEIICIDDGSTDGSAAILAEYAGRDPRFRIITFERNRGVGAARNAGLDAACGEYLGFVDSDDFVDCDFYAKVVEPHMDVVLGELVEERYDDRGIVVETLNVEYNRQQRLEAVRYKSGFRGLFPVAVYRRELVARHGLKFVEGRIVGEDRLFPLKARYCAEHVASVDGTYYHYCHRLNSITRSSTTRRFVDDALSFVRDVADFLREYSLPDEDRRFLVNHTFFDMIYEPLLQEQFREDTIAAAMDFIEKFHEFCDYGRESVLALFAAIRRGNGIKAATEKLRVDAMRANVRRSIQCQ